MTNTNADQAPNQLEDLFTELRVALEAQHEAGYQRAKYVWSTRGLDDTLDAAENMLQATAKADELVAGVWRKLYDLAPALADAIQVHVPRADWTAHPYGRVWSPGTLARGLGAPCLVPDGCPDPETGMPCNTCWDRQKAEA